MIAITVLIFVLGYAAIALEHPLKLNKAASAMVTGMVIWAIVAIAAGSDHELLHSSLHESFIEAGEILFFLLGAMTIVETIDIHHGFNVITSRITTLNKIKLMWIVSTLTFFLSALLDNLTTTIVMVTLLQKIIADKQSRKVFIGLVILSANAGGAWSPIGDVTTTMLWIGKQIETVPIITELFIPSLVCMVVPLGIASYIFARRGDTQLPPPVKDTEHTDHTTSGEKILLFVAGIAGLVFVPIFKTVTHLPPFMGMTLSLGLIWGLTEIIHRNKSEVVQKDLSVIRALSKVDMSSIYFFLGILLAVGGLQYLGVLTSVATWLDTVFHHNIYFINMTIGLLSAIVDNVPLVAASMNMYEITDHGVFAKNGMFWELLAYCAGTGGSVLIIGSAAGVAAMGLEKIEFGWYLKHISLLALIGFLSGTLTFYLMNM